MDYLNINESKEKEIIPGYFAKFIHSDNVTIAYWRILENSAMPEHSHQSEQIVNMIEGEFELIVEKEKIILKKGDIVKIQSNIHHSGIALTDCKIIDIFYPTRTDYK
jgi:quercetin dioxygenase-like cupin family protein